MIRVATCFLLTCSLYSGTLRAAETASSPFFALCMDMHDAKKRSLADQAALLEELGYAGAGHVWLKGVDERIKTLQERALKLFQVYVRVNVAPNARQAYDPKLKAVMPLLGKHGTQVALLVIGGKPSDESQDGRAVELIREIADLAAQSKAQVVLYPHQNHWLERVEDAIRLAKKAERPNVGIMWNLCHWLKVDADEDAAAMCREAMPYLKAVSINGADRGADIRSGKGNWIQPLGQGSFDMESFLKALFDSGYKGPIGLQCYGIKGDARVHLAESIREWKRLQSKAAR